MFDVTRWWYKRGVSGFRLDAVDTLYEDPKLHDNPILPGENAFGDPNEEKKYNDKLPEVHDTLRELRKVADEYNAVLIGETWTANIAELNHYYGKGNNELQMPMDFLFTTVNKLSPADFRKQIAAVDSASGWPTFVISNHDIVALLRPLRRRPAQRSDREVDGRAIPHPARNSDHVLRRRDRNEDDDAHA